MLDFIKNKNTTDKTTLPKENKGGLYRFYKELKSYEDAKGRFFIDCGEDYPILYVSVHGYDENVKQIKLFVIKEYWDNRTKEPYHTGVYDRYVFENSNDEYSLSDVTYCKENRVITEEEYINLIDERRKKYIDKFKELDCSKDWYHYGNFDNTLPNKSLYKVHIDAKIYDGELCEVVYSATDMIYDDNKSVKIGTLEWSEFQRTYSEVCPEYVKY